MERDCKTIELLNDIRAVVACHDVCSIGSYPASAELLSFFDSCSRTQALAPSAPSAVPDALPGRRETSGENTNLQAQRVSDHAAVSEIAAEVAQCNSCSLSGRRIVSMAGKGGAGTVRLMIVGHWLPVTQGSQGGFVFGLEEDGMVDRMLTAINLGKDEVFISNVIKCGIGSGVQPQAEHIDVCLSFLQRQIAALEPEIICTMGMVATKTLLRLSQPLSKLRGRFYDYKLADGQTVALLPTYHPGYLLENPEMKNATWQDLQAIQKRLG